MDVNIKLANGSVVNQLDIIGNTVDFSTKQMVIHLQGYDAHGNQVGTFEYDHQLTDFPVPGIDAQWAIVTPHINDIMASQMATEQS